MNYFILFYRIIVESGQTHCGKTIKATKGTILIESEIIPLIESEYRHIYPSYNRIKVSILKVRETSFQVYDGFLKIKNMQEGTSQFFMDNHGDNSLSN